jgi:hypothetical protein
LRFGRGEPDCPIEVDGEVVRVGDHDEGTGAELAEPVPAGVMDERSG